MTDYELNTARLEQGVQGEAWGDAVRSFETENGIERRCYIMISTDENDPSETVYLQLRKDVLKKVIKYSQEDLNLLEEEL